MRRLRLVVAAAGLTVVGAVAVATPSSAAGGVKVGCSVTDLQTAITNANTAGSGTIELASNCFYTVITPSTSTEAFPPITGNITIVGGRTTILKRSLSAAAFRIFTVNPAGILHLSRVTLENGSSSGEGGAVRVEATGTLVAKHVVMQDNLARDGGAVEVDASGVATIVSSELDANETTSDGGGGVLNSGTLSLRRTVVEFNSAPDDGGGINTQFGAVTKLVRSIVRHNFAGHFGGGIQNLGGTTQLKDSSVKQNTAGISGGGVEAAAGSVTLRRSKVVRNEPDNCDPPGSVRHCRH